MHLKKVKTASLEIPTMDTELIGSLESGPYDRPSFGSFVKAVLFASGEFRRLENDADVYGLVLRGYEGLTFGDDGTFTAMVASELPVEKWDGVNRIAGEINEALITVNPAYCAKYVGPLSGAYLEIDVKRRFGLPLPQTVSFENVSISPAT
jgi:hypothetical protein